MKKLLNILIAMLLACALATPGMAAKPRNVDGMPFGNGFPSGEHYNLNLIGKRPGFSCPSATFDDSGTQEFGNVIFVPRDPNDPITILMESGTKGPKGAPETSKLEVTDWCTETIPDANGAADPAIMRLPAHANGYMVYARITGKPGDNTRVDITQGADGAGFKYVEDERGNDLLGLGLVTADGIYGFSSDGETLVRTNSDTWAVSYETKGSKKGKGVLKALEITGLFEWSGEVCYLTEANQAEYCPIDADPACTSLQLCCTDTNGDGVFDSCTTPGIDGCPVDDTVFTVEAMCRRYADEWVFNIADFVGYLWNIANNGAYVVQVRFYPVP